MAIPILDTSTTILRRWRRHVSVFQPDDEHLHHRLLRLGTTPRRAAACLWLLTIAFGSLGPVFQGSSGVGILALGAAAAAAIELAYTLPREGQPAAGEALGYLFGLKTSLGGTVPPAQLAEVIEMQPYQRLRRNAGLMDRTTAAAPASPAPLVTAEPPPARAGTPGPAAAKVGAAGESQDDVVLAVTDDPH